MKWEHYLHISWSAIEPFRRVLRVLMHIPNSDSNLWGSSSLYIDLLSGVWGDCGAWNRSPSHFSPLRINFCLEEDNRCWEQMKGCMSNRKIEMGNNELAVSTVLNAEGSLSFQYWEYFEKRKKRINQTYRGIETFSIQYHGYQLCSELVFGEECITKPLITPSMW